MNSITGNTCLSITRNAIYGWVNKAIESAAWSITMLENFLKFKINIYN